MSRKSSREKKNKSVCRSPAAAMVLAAGLMAGAGLMSAAQSIYAAQSQAPSSGTEILVGPPAAVGTSAASASASQAELEAWTHGQDWTSSEDYDAFCRFLDQREAVWQEEMAVKLEKVGIPRERQSFIHGPGYRDIRDQMLAMSAVYRSGTIYNRIVCQWYAENLWKESITYQVIGKRGQQDLYPILEETGRAAGCLFPGGGQLSLAMDALQAQLLRQANVTVVLEMRPMEEVYAMDSCRMRIPVEWDGWTEENRERCDQLLSLEGDAFQTAVREMVKDSLLDSPVPFYKQGAILWGSNPFGSGTIAGDACCPTSIAMVVSYFYRERITPDVIAAQYDQDAYRNLSQGAYGGKMCAAAGADYGLKTDAGSGDLSGSQIREALAAGAKIVMSMRPDQKGGRYATVYHYVVLAGLTEDGRVIVNNPGINTDVTYDSMDVILENQSGRGYGIFYGPAE